MKTSLKASNHSTLDYYECYAKIVLEELYPEEFQNLLIIDKPDLQSIDGSVGIEVTNAIDKNVMEAEKLYSEISCNSAKKPQKALKRIEECGHKLEDGVLFYSKKGILDYSLSENSFCSIIKSFDNKLTKLNGGQYKPFKNNHLFIFSYIFCNDKMIKDAVSEMRKKQANMELKFYKVYLLIPGRCYSFDLYTGNYKEYPINYTLQSSQAYKAYELSKYHKNK